MIVKNVFEKIEKLNEKFIDIWEDVCNIESPSDYKEGVDKVGRYFIELARKNSWHTEVFNQEKFVNVVCITMNSHSKLMPVTISGHMDTVHPVSSFGSPASHRDANNLYALGAV